MTIGEVINMLMEIFAVIAEVFSGLFGKKEEENDDAANEETTVA